MSRRPFIDDDDLRRRFNIVEFIRRHVRLKRSGSKYVGLCPFHPDHNPSFTVYTDSQRYYCFGCHASGDVVTFKATIDGIDWYDALSELENEASLHGPKVEHGPAGPDVTRRPRPRSAHQTATSLLSGLETELLGTVKREQALCNSGHLPLLKFYSRDGAFDDLWAAFDGIAPALSFCAKRAPTEVAIQSDILWNALDEFGNRVRVLTGLGVLGEEEARRLWRITTVIRDAVGSWQVCGDVEPG